MENFDLYSILIGSLLKVMLGYILFGIIVVMITETIISLSQLRGRFLRKELKKVIDDKEIFEKIFNHPLIKPHGKFPAYINFDFFADALIDCLKIKDVYLNTDKEKRNVGIEKGNFKSFLTSLIQKNKNLKGFKKSLIDWFLDYMRNLSGIYKKYVKLLISSITFILVIACNLDSIEMFQAFYKDDSAKELINAVKDDQTSIDKLEKLINESFPIGWDSESSFWAILSLTKLIGFLLTIVMISITSIIVFDILGKYVNIRSVYSPHSKN